MNQIVDCVKDLAGKCINGVVENIKGRSEDVVEDKVAGDYVTLTDAHAEDTSKINWFKYIILIILCVVILWFLGCGRRFAPCTKWWEIWIYYVIALTFLFMLVSTSPWFENL